MDGWRYKLRNLELRLVGRCYCAFYEYGAGRRWGTPMPTKRLALIDRRLRSMSKKHVWLVAKFGRSRRIGSIET